jgi:hypothetical protein
MMEPSEDGGMEDVMCEGALTSIGAGSQDYGFCGLCKVEVPLLTTRQVIEIEKICSHVLEEVKAYRAEHGGPGVGLPQADIFAPVYDKHLALTGVDLRGISLSAHHILVHQKSCLGPPCWSCGRLLRSQSDRHCSECGAEKKPG